MKLYIEIQNGEAINHPAFEDNLIQVFGSIPNNWENFVRVEKPILSVYQVFDSETPIYKKIDDVWSDFWLIRDMTNEEKLAKQQFVINKFNSREQASNWSAWTFNEETCKMQPPISKPELDNNKLQQGIYTFWCGSENNWKDTPAQPIDENEYKFDFFAWNWVKV